jgi:hypothetical protein
MHCQISACIDSSMTGVRVQDVCTRACSVVVCQANEIEVPCRLPHDARCEAVFPNLQTIRYSSSSKFWFASRCSEGLLATELVKNEAGGAPPCRPPLSEEGRLGGAEDETKLDETKRDETRLDETKRGGERVLVAELARGEAGVPTPASHGGLLVLPLAKGEQ